MRVLLAVCVAFTLLGAVNWLAVGTYRMAASAHLPQQPVEDLFAFLAQIVGNGGAFWLQNLVYVAVGLAGLAAFGIFLFGVTTRPVRKFPEAVAYV